MKELERRLLTELGKRMPKWGFSQKPQGHTFYRDTEFGWTAFHLSFIRHTGDFDVTADVAIRVDVLERLTTGVDGDSVPRRDQTASMGAELGNISRGEQRRWTVAAEDDIAIRPSTPFGARKPSVSPCC
jgi:hypothetical protein